MSPAEFALIIDQDVPEGWRVLAVAVPTRAFRIIVDATSFIFRVEQLDTSQGRNGVYTWHIRSTHAGDFEFESYPSAINDMLSKQVRLKEMIKLAQHEQKMAMIAAQSALEKTT